MDLLRPHAMLLAYYSLLITFHLTELLGFLVSLLTRQELGLLSPPDAAVPHSIHTRLRSYD